MDYSKKPAEDCLNVIMGYGNIGKNIFQQYGENPTIIISKSYNPLMAGQVKNIHDFTNLDFKTVEESTILIHLCIHHKYLKQALRDNFNSKVIKNLQTFNKKLIIFNYSLTASDLIENFLINTLGISQDSIGIYDAQLSHKSKIMPRLTPVGFVNYYLGFYKGNYFTEGGMLEHAYGKLEGQLLTPENVAKLYTYCYKYYDKARNSLR